MSKVNLNILVAVCVFLAVLAGAAAADTHYVSPGQSIQAVIDDPCTVDGDEIEVAPGTYYEAINFNGKAVRLYSSGGSEVTTIDANGAYHAVKCVNSEDANTILEGFTITGGDANGSSFPDYYGGGMYNENSSPTVTYCIFSGNSADYGGGMYNRNSGPTIINCTFSGNTADYGSGMYNHYSSPTVTDCNFTGNHAEQNGGGMDNYHSSPKVTGCTFSENTADTGGGMHNGFSNPTVANCTFSGNSTRQRAGMSNAFSNPTVVNCTFSGNIASVSSGSGGGMGNNNNNPIIIGCTFIGNEAYDGGGMSNVYDGNPTVINCSFSGNLGFWGGGMHCYDSSPAVTGCIFTGNSAKYGGGIENRASSPTVTNCTFSKNSAVYYGGGMYNWQSSSPNVRNSIFWGESPDEIYNDYSTPTVTYCDVQGGYGGTGNINADPCFVDVNNPDPNLWNLRLMPDSPCIDAADNSSVPLDTTDLDNDGNTVEPIPFDLGGFPRFIDGDCNDTDVVDMGAYEYLRSDIDSNGDVNFKDFSRFALYWLDIACGACGGADLTCDGDVDWNDLRKLAYWWLAGI